MKEALEHIRLLHYILMGAAIAAIILAFAKHSDVSDRYDGAVEEVSIVRGLVGLDWKEGGDTVRNEFPPLVLPTIQRTRDEIKRRAALFISENFTQELLKRTSTTDPNGVKISFVTPFIYQADLPITSTFKEIVAYFDSIPILAALPDVDDLLTNTKVFSGALAQGSLVEISVEANADLGAHVKQFGWVSNTLEFMATVRVRLTHSGATPVEEKADVKTHIGKIGGFSQLNVLLRSYPFLYEVLPRIEDLTPDQAIFYLEEKALTAPLSASFLGIAVPRSMVPITVSAIIGLLVMFSSSLNRIDRMLFINSDYKRPVREFSWICLFGDRWSRGFSAVTVLGLPVAAAAFLCLSGMLGVRVTPSLLGLLGVFLTVGICMHLSNKALEIIRSIRRLTLLPEDETDRSFLLSDLFVKVYGRIGIATSNAARKVFRSRGRS